MTPAEGHPPRAKRGAANCVETWARATKPSTWSPSWPPLLQMPGWSRREISNLPPAPTVLCPTAWPSLAGRGSSGCWRMRSPDQGLRRSWVFSSKTNARGRVWRGRGRLGKQWGEGAARCWGGQVAGWWGPRWAVKKTAGLYHWNVLELISRALRKCLWMVTFSGSRFLTITLLSRKSPCSVGDPHWRGGGSERS